MIDEKRAIKKRRIVLLLMVLALAVSIGFFTFGLTGYGSIQAKRSLGPFYFMFLAPLVVTTFVAYVLPLEMKRVWGSLIVGFIIIFSWLNYHFVYNPFMEIAVTGPAVQEELETRLAEEYPDRTWSYEDGFEHMFRATQFAVVFDDEPDTIYQMTVRDDEIYIISRFE
ncbi:hypothetical protein FLK61_41270 [Paenalkalicoccus suaedae]|uniref:Uncharacterized protein n=1 Tax=Paenalkalicoccus suaedae TaxID=2592382 RepID=A0A859FJP1_9BACI|nr:hypothetical protein [Paenalkalicoccus suaedae]QKS73024.1 hypothetical protein FLK61_41270 [Paenalkalicoccus suaedae]